MVLGFRDEAYYDGVREHLAKVNFTTHGIAQAIGREDILAMPLSDVPQVMRRIREPSPLHALIQLVFLGLPIRTAEARRALAPIPLEAWIEANLLTLLDDQDAVTPLVQIWPVRELLMAVDLPWRRETAPPADFVLPPGPLSLQLDDVMIACPEGRVLDLGTGSGFLALRAATWASAVTATDTNPRALAFTRLNARLNGLRHVECCAGSLFEPVGDRQFDRIVCNPPFVISPTIRFTYRDSGQRGDEFCRTLIRAAASHLAPQGFFQCTGNVPHGRRRSWREDLKSWFTGLGCDALVLVERTEDASTYVTNWLLSTESKEMTEVSRRYDVWMNYFDELGIEAVSIFLATLRRGAGANPWIHIDDPPCSFSGPCGAELVRFFQWRDRFHAEPAAASWLGHTLSLAQGLRLRREFEMTREGLEERDVELRKAGGWEYPLKVHAHVLPLLAGCDGSTTFGQLIEVLAGQWSLPAAKVVDIVLPAVRSLLERGVLVADDGRNVDRP